MPEVESAPLKATVSAWLYQPFESGLREGVAVTMGAARARRGGDPWRGALTGAAVYGAVVLAAGLLLPRINEVPADFPGDLLWRFRMAALAVQAVLWGAAGLIFGWLAARMGRPLAQAAA